MSADVGFWSGSLSYAPVYAPGGLEVSIGTGPDANGISWIWQTIDGWDSPDVVGQVIQRSADHGGWPASQFYAPRVITVTVMASAPTQALRDTARAVFQQVIPPGISPNDLAVLTYNEPVPKQALVRRSGRITEQKPTLTDVIFTANLVAPDPRKYSAQPKSSTAYIAATSAGGGLVVPFTVPFTLDPGTPPGVMTVTNAGTFETRPVITLKGPLTAPKISNVTYGMTVPFSQVTLGATDVLTVDMDARAASLNGSYRTADLSSAWWVLEPGANILELGSASAGSGASFTCSWSDSWM